MTQTRKEMEAELEQLVPVASYRAIHLRRDDAGLARALERLRRDRAETLRVGHINATGIGVRVLHRA